jgi:hypothetical protein
MSLASQEDIVLNSYNLYLDTGRVSGADRGDSISISLAQQSINVSDGQLIRLSVNEFCMSKSWSDVNFNNSFFSMQSNITGTTLTQIGMTQQNYQTVRDIALDFAATMITQINTYTGSVYTASLILPAAATTINGTTNNIISFTLTCVGANALTSLVLSCFEEVGDSNLIIGGDRITDATIVPAPPSISIIVSNTGQTIEVQCLYPAQRSSTPYVYLRTGLTTHAVEQNSLTSPSGQTNLSDVLPSDILCRIPVNTEYCVYNATADRVFYIDPNQNNINTLRLFITDEHSRPIGRVFHSTLETASTAYFIGAAPLFAITPFGIHQSTLGNLSFSMVLRIDIVQKRLANQRFFPDPLEALNTKMLGVRMTPANYTGARAT